MAGRGRPRKITLEEDTIMAEEFYGDVKQMVRKIAKLAPNAETGVDTVFEVDAELDKWYKAGYRLFNTHFLASSLDSYDVLYVLVKA